VSTVKDDFAGLPERFENASVSAKRLLSYARAMQGETALSAIADFKPRELESVMALPETVLRHLEIFETYRGETAGSLFHAMDRTKTSAGARLLKRQLQFPLLRHSEIEKRLSRVEEWVKRPHELKALRQQLGGLGDIER